jgi:hypothetical protein
MRLVYLPAPDFWLDVLKTLIGAFVGAGLAFAFALFTQWRVRRRDEIKAGNLALATLVCQVNDLLAIKRAVESYRAKVLNDSPNAPLWYQTQPMLYAFPRETGFDLSALSFLFDKKGVKHLSPLLHAEALHRSLVLVMESHAEVQQEIRSRLAGQGLANGSAFEVEELERKVGMNLIAKANSATQAILDTIAKDLPHLETTFENLRKDLVERFGNKFVDKQAKAKPEEEAPPK